MISLRPSDQRGHFDHGWLDTYHSFSFGHYYDPAQVGFRQLRVINQDIIAPGGEFGMHPHRDMEIITYILEGALAHKDSMGNGSTIYPGDVQRMSAGSGILHSEANPSQADRTHLLQIWILPDKIGRQPEYEQKTITEEGKIDRLRLIASPDGRDDSVKIHQKVSIFDSHLRQGKTISYSFAEGRFGWIQVSSGEITINGKKLTAGDGASISGEKAVEIEGLADSGLLLFDLN